MICYNFQNKLHSSRKKVVYIHMQLLNIETLEQFLYFFAFCETQRKVKKTTTGQQQRLRFRVWQEVGYEYLQSRKRGRRERVFRRSRLDASWLIVIHELIVNVSQCACEPSLTVSVAFFLLDHRRHFFVPSLSQTRRRKSRRLDNATNNPKASNQQPTLCSARTIKVNDDVAME